jgi:hypothetical protein
MTLPSDALQYLMRRSPKDTVARVSARVAAIIADPRVLKTEVIREGGFVHGSVYPVPKTGPRKP